MSDLITSEVHRLTVHQDPEDGLEVTHPDSCPWRTADYGDGHLYRDHTCLVASALAFAGFDPFFVHPEGPNPLGAEPLPVGEYQFVAKYQPESFVSGCGLVIDPEEWIELVEQEASS